MRCRLSTTRSAASSPSFEPPRRSRRLPMRFQPAAAATGRVDLIPFRNAFELRRPWHLEDGVSRCDLATINLQNDQKTRLPTPSEGDLSCSSRAPTPSEGNLSRSSRAPTPSEGDLSRSSRAPTPSEGNLSRSRRAPTPSEGDLSCSSRHRRRRKATSTARRSRSPRRQAA